MIEEKSNMSFVEYFQAITGNAPFPWQQRMYDEFVRGNISSTANIPTGLGKTSVVAIWLIALALHPDKMPRRLVYVVNRRTVVDQTTIEVENLRNALTQNTKLRALSDNLRQLCALPLPQPNSSPLAISTLRGQFADNREWSGDPARPAVIVGTVDMIGSGLLFSRYTAGFKMRPHHAAFLGQDALLVHDEAHLEPAFQKLLESVVVEQAKSNDPRKLKIMELSATTRSDGSVEPFGITKKDEENDCINKRLNAVKKLSLVALVEGEKEQDRITELALSWRDKKRTVLVFVCPVNAATQIAVEIGKKVGTERVLTLTGTMRGKERDELVRKPLFERFLSNHKNKTSEEDTVWLVATSAGEVGVNFSADEMICDLSTYESMAQRLGRLNRFGECDESSVTIVCPFLLGKKDKQGKVIQSEFDIARERTLALLHKLGDNACPAALEGLNATERLAAFSPPPQIRTTTAIQYDAWALTSIRKPIAARPPVAPYLHGETEWQPPETHIAWRDDPEIIQGPLLDAYSPEDLLDDFPLKPHELLRDTSRRIAETLSARIETYFQEKTANQKHRDLPPAWIISENGMVELFPLICSENLLAAYMNRKPNNNQKELIKVHKSTLEDHIANATLILPSCLAGISSQGLFISDAKESNTPDVAMIEGIRMRFHVSSPELPAKHAADYRVLRIVDTCLDDEDAKESPKRYWLWLEAKNTVNAEKRSTTQPETLAAHTKAVVSNVVAIAKKLFPATLPASEPNLHRCQHIAAGLHDTGKDRQPWQLGIGNNHYNPANPETILAKSGGSLRQRNLSQNYRHEFGSLGTAANDAINQGALAELSEMERDIVLHLVAAHHGRGRPHFPGDEVFDYNFSPEVCMDLAAEVPLRFGRLQQKFGRWGLVWLESILRSADYAASAGLVADTVDIPAPSKIIPAHVSTPCRQNREANIISLRVDVSNPGQYFACCGLFELADKMNPGILAHFEQDVLTKQWRFVLQSEPYGKEGLPITIESLLKTFAIAELAAADNQADFDNHTSEFNTNADGCPDSDEKEQKAPPLRVASPFNLRLDWWETASKNTSALKVWAGSMNCLRIARAMQNAVGQIVDQNNFIDNAEDILFDSRVVYESSLTSKKKTKKVEPFYFDSLRGPNADSRDVGFSPNSMKLETIASPTVEILCLIWLQRAIPAPAGKPRQFAYHLWTQPLPITLIGVAINGLLQGRHQKYQFESWFRTSQKKHKAFLPALQIIQ
jgi:CRISPR-associated endonuclease/helicase Cas3